MHQRQLSIDERIYKYILNDKKKSEVPLSFFPIFGVFFTKKVNYVLKIYIFLILKFCRRSNLSYKVNVSIRRWEVKNRRRLWLDSLPKRKKCIFLCYQTECSTKTFVLACTFYVTDRYSLLFIGVKLES